MVGWKNVQADILIINNFQLFKIHKETQQQKSKTNIVDSIDIR